MPLQYERAVLSGAAVREKLRSTVATRGRAYDVVAHQQAAMPEQLLAPEAADPDHDDEEQEPGRQEAVDLTALRALRLIRLEDAFTAAADRARATMDRYAHRDDAERPHPVREDDQRAHRPQEPGPHRGREAGHWVHPMPHPMLCIATAMPRIHSTGWAPLHRVESTGREWSTPCSASCPSR
ncbi:hypothetical protein ACFYZB_38055 [Streptomyces sp. NPDC001852]|uniref:hypothetical protein n=1 Tax=Streptomyces sp. NPDC001852 TaxID=3364619 RepID=UPI00368B6C38